MGKDVAVGTKAREEMLKGVDILADAVKATLGPRGRNVAIERVSGPPLITKDGVTVARNIYLDNRLQNIGAQLVKSVAAAANNSAGDGTTTATVLAQAIYKGGMKMVAAGNNPVLVKRGIDIAVENVLNQLSEMAIKISSPDTLLNVATISANNDKVLGQQIAEAIATIGNDGIISVEEATGSKTHVEYVEGIKLDRGLLAEGFVTDDKKFVAELTDCKILLYADKITSIHDLAGVLKEFSGEGAFSGKNLLIIVKDIDNDSLAHVLYNKLNGALNVCVIKSPGFGSTGRAILEDIGIVTSGKVFTNDDHRILSDFQLQDLGFAKKIVVSINSTIIFEGKSDPSVVQSRIDDLKRLSASGSLHDYQEESLRYRIARLSGGIAVFKVGGATESEMRETKDRVEDAINAVRSAIDQGVVPGGGSSLIHCISGLKTIDRSDLLSEEIIGIDILQEALKAPFKQILFNAGGDELVYQHLSQVLSGPKYSGFDALKLRYEENMVEKGIMDPAKVVKSALQHAASASGTLLTTEVAIYEAEREGSD